MLKVGEGSWVVGGLRLFVRCLLSYGLEWLVGRGDRWQTAGLQSYRADGKIAKHAVAQKQRGLQVESGARKLEASLEAGAVVERGTCSETAG